MSAEVAGKLIALANAGATIILTEAPAHEPGLTAAKTAAKTRRLYQQLGGDTFTHAADGTMEKTPR